MNRKQINELVKEWEPRIRTAFLRSFDAVRNDAQILAIEARLKAGDVDGALKAVGISAAQFRPLDIALNQAYEAGGNATASTLPALRDGSGPKLKIIFDVRAFASEAWIKERSSSLVTEIVQDQRQLIKDFLFKGLASGENPRKTALDLVGRISPDGSRSGGVIGLTTNQERWVSSYRKELESGSKSALLRSLRDKRFDRSLLSSIEGKTPIPQERIEAMVMAYRNRALRYRAETIARTETIPALNRAQKESTQQAIQSGQLNADQVKKVWVSTNDSRTRDTHASMDRQEVGINELFTSPSGAHLEYPGDANAPASEVIKCRCKMFIRVNYLAGLT
jgi:hypothetical protein